MYVMPCGIIELYSGVPLREDYQNTFSFQNSTAQRTYFVSKRVMELTEQLYTRRGNGSVRVKANLAELLNVDYLSFLNHGSVSTSNNTSIVLNNNKRFYCFVTNMAYVNENVTDIFFIVDVIQTYMFDITYKKSYVEQMHVNLLEDYAYQHADLDETYILPQNVDVGEYVYNPILVNAGNISDVFGNFVYVVAATFDKNFNSAVGGLQNGFYSGLAFNVFDTVSDINTFLLSAASNNKADGIVGVFMAPEAFAKYPGQESFPILIPREIFETTYTSWAGYTPHNGILYNAPFCKFLITDNNGNGAEFEPQLFSGFYRDEQTLKYYYKFMCTGVCAGSNEFSIYPYDYKGVLDNYNEQIVLNVTPQCAYATDSYRAWLAQNSAKMSVESAYAGKNAMIANEKATYDKIYSDKSASLGMASTTLSAVSNVANSRSIGGLIGNTVNAVGQVALASQQANLSYSYNAENYALSKIAAANDYAHTIGLLNAAAGVASTMPPHASGNASGMAGTVNGAYRISIYIAVPCYAMAKKLDDYFDMYGYRIDSLRVPDFKTRKFWNYIRCAQFNAEGTNIPGEYFDIIKTIFERGITFWHDTTKFLDYSQNNHQNYVTQGV